MIEMDHATFAYQLFSEQFAQCGMTKVVKQEWDSPVNMSLYGRLLPTSTWAQLTLKPDAWLQSCLWINQEAAHWFTFRIDEAMTIERFAYNGHSYELHYATQFHPKGLQEELPMMRDGAMLVP